MGEQDSKIQIPGYDIIDKVAIGGMSTIYLANQKSVNRHVALKIMSESLLSDPTFSERFLREARIVAQLNHQNIVSVFDVGTHSGFHYISMEFLPGESLRSRISEGLLISQAIYVAREMASALHYAHSLGYVHRDVKPANIMFHADGTPKLTDFGIARSSNATQQMTMTGTVIGTPHYMSPEQALGHVVDYRADIYSLGVVLYEMLTGRVPFDADSAVAIGIKHITGTAEPLPEAVAQYQPLMDKLLTKEPSERIQTGAELIAALDNIAIVNDTKAPPREQKKEKVSVVSDPLSNNESSQNTDTVVKPVTLSNSGFNPPSATSSRAKNSFADSEFTASQKVLGQPNPITQSQQLHTQSGSGNFVNRILFSGSIIGIIAIVGFVMWPNVKIGTPNVENNTPTIKPTLLSSNDKTDKTSQESQWFDQASAILMSPAESNLIERQKAIAILDNILNQNPDHQEAATLLDNTVSKHQSLAEAYYHNSNYGKALQHIELALTGKPSDNKLTSLSKAYRSSFREQQALDQQREQSVQYHLSEAKTAEVDNRITTPTNNSAAFHYSQILKLEPNNPIATNKLQAIISTVINDALSEAKANNYANATKKLEQAENISFDKTAVENARSEVKKQQQAHKRAKRNQLIAAERRKQKQALNAKHSKIVSEIDKSLSVNAPTIQEIRKTIAQANEAKQLGVNQGQTNDLLNKITSTYTTLALNRAQSAQFAFAKRVFIELENLSEANKPSVRRAQEDIAAMELESIRQKAEQEKNTAQLNKLIAQANTLLLNDTKNAETYKELHQIYRQAKNIAPDDTRINTGLKSLEENMITTAQSLLDDTEFSKAESVANTGLKLYPNKNEFKQIKKQIDAKRALRNSTRTPQIF